MEDLGSCWKNQRNTKGVNWVSWREHLRVNPLFFLVSCRWSRASCLKSPFIQVWDKWLPFPSILNGRASWNQHHPNAVYFIWLYLIRMCLWIIYIYINHTTDIVHTYIYRHRGTKYMYWMTKKSVDIGWSRLTLWWTNKKLLKMAQSK